MSIFYLMLKGGLSFDVFSAEDIGKLKMIIQLENELMDVLHPKVIGQFNEQTKDMIHERPFWMSDIQKTPSTHAHKLFRKLSKVYHPDKGGDPDTFALIRKALDEDNVELLTKLSKEMGLDDDPDDDTEDDSNHDILNQFGRIPQIVDDIRWGWFRCDLGALIRSSFVKK